MSRSIIPSPNQQKQKRSFTPPIDVDADSMLFDALSWHFVAHKLEQEIPSSFYPNPFLQHGILMTLPILLPFAVETALKAWYCRDHNKRPNKEHRLRPLFDSLIPPSQNLLNERMSQLQLCLKSQTDTPDIIHQTSLPDLLSIHNDAFLISRYRTEYEFFPTLTPLLRLALALIIDSYHKHFNILHVNFSGPECTLCKLPSGQHSYRLYPYSQKRS